MKLSQIKRYLATAETVNFKLPNGEYIPEHFHVTEVGMVSKHFIDCGGVERREAVVNFQLWNADDTDHKLKPGKLLHIINLSEQKLGIQDLEIEVEYQAETIGRYGIDYDGTDFVLLAKQTACLANDACGIEAPKKIEIQLLADQTQNSCAPGSGCC